MRRPATQQSMPAAGPRPALFVPLWLAAAACALAAAATAIGTASYYRQMNAPAPRKKEAATEDVDEETVLVHAQEERGWTFVEDFPGFEKPQEPSDAAAKLDTPKGLEVLLRRNNPIAYFVGLRVQSLVAGKSLTLRAPVLPANANTHGTGFAGSIYVVAALAMWGALLSEMFRAKLCATHFHVIRSATIRYDRPVARDGNIVATCALPDAQPEGATLRWLTTANLKSCFEEARAGAPKVRFAVSATVHGARPDKPAAVVEAEVVLLPRTNH